MRRINEHWTEEQLPGGLIRRTYQRGQNYWDRDAQAFVATPDGLRPDDRSPGFSHVHKGQVWKRIGRGGLHRAGFGVGQDVTYLPIGAADVEPSVEGNVATYLNLWPSTDVTLEVLPEGIKETLTNRGDAPNSFAWDVILRGVVLDASGEFIDPLTGHVVGRLAAPVVQYADGARPGQLIIDGERVTITAEPGWLTIDPTTVIQPDAVAEDAYIYGGNAGGNYGATTMLRIGDTSYANQQFRSLIRPILGSLPADKWVLSAKLSLHTQALKAITAQARLPEADWSEAVVTWNNQPAANTVVSSASLNVTWAEFLGLAQTFQDWLSGTLDNRGLLLRKAVDGTTANDYADIDSSDAVTATNRPKWTVVTGDLPVMSPSGTAEAPAILADTLAPRLSITHPGAPTKTQWQILDSGGDLIHDSGEVVSANLYYDIPAGILKYGQTYRYRARACDGDWSAWTAWQYFYCTINPPSGLVITPDAEHAQITLAWDASTAPGLAGYGVMRKRHGDPDNKAVPFNTSPTTGTTYIDDTAACGVEYDYAVYCMAGNGHKGANSEWLQSSVTFQGAHFGSLIVLNRVHPRPQHNRRGSERMQTDGTYLIQTRGFGPRHMTITLAFRSMAERDAILAEITDMPISYRDDRGNAIRGIVVTSPEEEQLDVPREYMGYLTIVITEVTGR